MLLPNITNPIHMKIRKKKNLNTLMTLSHHSKLKLMRKRKSRNTIKKTRKRRKMKGVKIVQSQIKRKRLRLTLKKRRRISMTYINLLKIPRLK